MTISGYDCWKRKGLSRRRKLENVGAETSSGSPFQIRGPETSKVRLLTVGSQNIGTTRRLGLAVIYCAAEVVYLFHALLAVCEINILLLRNPFPTAATHMVSPCVTALKYLLVGN